ncbi:unnamed protein product [Mortierella alpina]
MFARSLLSLLAVATVALQTCAAISDGLYRISLPNELTLAVLGTGRILPVRLLPEHDDTWEVQNHEGETVTIVHSRTGHYLAPSFPAERERRDQAVVSDKEFFWRLKSAGQDREVIQRADGESLVLSRSDRGGFPPFVDVSRAHDGYVDQAWTFESSDDFRQKTEAHCGPWRFPRESIHFQ